MSIEPEPVRIYEKGITFPVFMGGSGKITIKAVNFDKILKVIILKGKEIPIVIHLTNGSQLFLPRSTISNIDALCTNLKNNGVNVIS